jgi:hypothetical protein
MPDEFASPKLLTLGQIARQLGVSLHRANHAIKTYGIRRSTRIGNLPVWREEELSRIQSALALTDAEYGKKYGSE